VAAGTLFVYPAVTWTILGTGAVLLLVFSQIPARHTLFECTKYGARFHLSIAEFYACARESGLWEVECRGCRGEEYARPVSPPGPSAVQ